MVEIKRRALNECDTLITIGLKLNKNRIQNLYAIIVKDNTEEIVWLNSFKNLQAHFNG